ncbi:MAG TPA: glycosyltransferase, partial [Phycisphaerae bacterium]|nr:glycosyltransferase [Phycisphaerae bacterium]
MRILTTSLCYPTPGHPDMGVFIQRRAIALAQVGHEIDVASPQPWCPLLRKTQPCPTQTAPLRAVFPRMVSVPPLSWVTDGLAYGRALTRTIRDLRKTTGRTFDLIDAHFVYPDGVGALLAARKLGLPIVVTVRGKIVSLSRRPVRRAQIRAMLRRVDGIIAVSESLARCVREVAGDDLRVEVIPNGIDTATFHPVDRAEARRELGWTPYTRYVLAVGHLQRLKGFDRLVEIWPGVRTALGGGRLILAGSRRGEADFADQLLADIDRINRTMANHTGPPGIAFVGPQSPRQLNLMYNAADLLVSSSRSEGWCNALGEALAAGTPVVATDVGGNREQIISADLGRIVPDGDSRSLARAVIEALTIRWDR